MLRRNSIKLCKDICKKYDVIMLCCGASVYCGRKCQGIDAS